MQCLDDETLTGFLEGEMPAGRAAEVEQHLAECSACRRLVAIVAGDLAPTDLGATTPHVSAARNLPRGSKLGRYVVVELRGAGGMGVVYAAHDPELDRKVALKVLHPGLGLPGAERAARMEREARAIARLAHPNVVAIFDTGSHDDTAFIAMELVEGGSVDSWLRAEPRPWSEVLAIYLQAAAGLAAAHAAGLVHRDFKPANVLVGADGRARVSDFGLARLSDPEEPRSDVDRSPLGGLTVTGARVGTPGYMAPEQAKGKPADARSDQFSFAVSLYEGLYGARPFAGDTLDEILVHIERGEIIPAPTTTDVPSWLRAAILPALAARPEARWSSMEAMIVQLRGGPRSRRRRIVIALAVLAPVAAITTGWGFGRASAPATLICSDASSRLSAIWDAPRRQALGEAFRAAGKPYGDAAWRAADRDLDRYARAWVAMRNDACAATWTRGEQSEDLLDLRMQCLDQRLGELDALAQALAHADASVIGKAAAAIDGLSRVADCANLSWLRARVRRPQSPILRGQIEAAEHELARATALEATGQYRQALPIARATADTARLINFSPLTAAAELRLASLQAAAGDRPSQVAGIKRAILAAEAGADDVVAVRAWTQLLLSETAQHHDGPASDAGEHARALLHKIPGDSYSEGCLAFGLAAMFEQQGKYPEAEVEARRAVALIGKAEGGTGREVANAIDRLSKILSDTGHTAEALTLSEQALHMAEQALGPSHPEIAYILDGLAQIQENLDRLDESRATILRTLAIREAALAPNHPLLGTTLSNLAMLDVELHRYEEALDHDQRALAILLPKLGPDHPSVANAHENMSKAELALGRLDAAVRDAELSLQIREKAFGEQHDDVAASLHRLSQARLAQGKHEAALAAARRAITIDEGVLGKDHPMLVDLYADLTDVLLHTDQMAAAIAAADRALEVAAAAQVPAGRRGGVQFLRARARWKAGDRAGARADADAARAALAQETASHAELVEVDSWLAAHPRP